MEVKFAPSFFKSLKKISRQNTWWYKTYEFFRYKIGWFFRNIWKFRKELYKHRPWDSVYSLSMLRRSLEEICNNIEKYGIEVETSRLKKVEKMERAIEILKWHEGDKFIELAEKELGYETNCNFLFKDEPSDITESNRKIFNLSTKIEEDSFNELLQIFKGQDINDFIKINNDLKEKYKDNPDEYFIESENLHDNWFDGSGLKSWWD